MTVKAYICVDEDGVPRAYNTAHEVWAAKEIVKELYRRFNASSEYYAVIADMSEPFADMVCITQRGIGVLDLKHYYGDIQIKSDGRWFAGPTPIKAGNYRDPHDQVQSYANQLYSRLQPLLPAPLRKLIKSVACHTAICFTHPDANIKQVQAQARRRYQPKRGLYEWERFSVESLDSICDWVFDLRLEVDLGSPKLNDTYRLDPGFIEQVVFGPMRAIVWSEAMALLPPGQPHSYLWLMEEGRYALHYPLDSTRVTIGRGSDCGILLPATALKVSRVQARITRRVDGSMYFTDLSAKDNEPSTSYVDDVQVVKETELQDGARIILGSADPNDELACVLDFRLDAPAGARAGTFRG